MDDKWRAKHLKEWEELRSRELVADLLAYGWRASVGLAVIGLAWVTAALLDSRNFRAVIVYCAAAYLVGIVSVWLRTWGSYIERRLVEIEALIGNKQPYYYLGDDLVSFEENPLFQRLNEIEGRIAAVEQLVTNSPAKDQVNGYPVRKQNDDNPLFERLDGISRQIGELHDEISGDY